MADDLIDRVTHDLASGRTVDWDAVCAQAAGPAERELLEALRVVHQLGQGNRALPPSDDLGSESAMTQTATVVIAPGADSAPRDVWGRYRLVREVGAGSFGRVYQASDADLDLDVAIKILHRHVNDELLKQRLLNEGRALAKVRHENVVRVLGVEFNDNRVGLCTEFIHGETLEQEVKARGTFSQAQAIEVGKAVCQALSAVHRAGFLHRDVKARNIMRERDTGRIVLMDFGTGRDLARELESPAPGIDGTAIYMAPEVLIGEPASYSSDTYSVGVVLYHVLTAAYPVEGGSLPALKEAHRAGLRTPLGVRRPDLPPSFVRIVERALAPKADRYATPAALCDALEKASSDRRSPLLRRLHRLAVTSAAVVAAFTALGFINTMYFNAVLGRLGFVDEGFWDWLKWGVRSTLAPLAVVAMALTVLTLVGELLRLVLRMSSGAQRAARRLAAFVHRRSLDDVAALSSISLLLSFMILFGTGWYFAPLIGALGDLFPDISTVAIDRLAMFSPDYGELHWSYRKAFSVATIACALLWYPAVRQAFRTRQPIPRHVAIGGAIVLAISVVLLDFPYRLLTHDIDFEEVSWNGHACHVIGQRGEDRLIFCPDFPAPRSRTVRSDSITGHTEPVDRHDVVIGVDAKRQRSIFKFLLNEQYRRVRE